MLVAAGETDADIDAALAGPARAAARRPAPAPASLAAPAAARAGGVHGGQRPARARRDRDKRAPGAGRGGRIFASPLVRKLAGERGIDLAGLAGTGPNGRIVRRDLERFLGGGRRPRRSCPRRPAWPRQRPPAPLAPPSGRRAGGRRSTQPFWMTGLPRRGRRRRDRPGRRDLIPHTPMRRAIARRLTESKATVPHFYLTAEPVVDELLALRERVNEALHGNRPGRR